MFRVAYYISKKKQLGKKVKLKFLAEKVKKKKSKFIQQECKPTTSIKQQSREGTEKAVWGTEVNNSAVMIVSLCLYFLEQQNHNVARYGRISLKSWE